MSTTRSCRLNRDEAGDIFAACHTSPARALGGDLFIDCSGFASLLIGKHFGVPFLPSKESLFIDRAWAVQVPYRVEGAEIASVDGFYGAVVRLGVGYRSHQLDAASVMCSRAGMCLMMRRSRS